MNAGRRARDDACERKIQGVAGCDDFKAILEVRVRREPERRGRFPYDPGPGFDGIAHGIACETDPADFPACKADLLRAMVSDPDDRLATRDIEHVVRRDEAKRYIVARSKDQLRFLADDLRHPCACRNLDQSLAAFSRRIRERVDLCLQLRDLIQKILSLFGQFVASRQAAKELNANGRFQSQHAPPQSRRALSGRVCCRRKPALTRDGEEKPEVIPIHFIHEMMITIGFMDGSIRCGQNEAMETLEGALS